MKKIPILPAVVLTALLVGGSILTAVGGSASVASAGTSPVPRAAAGGGWKPSPTCHTTNPAVLAAIKATEAQTVPSSTWYGPKTEPKIKPHVKIIFIPTETNNALSYTWGEDILAVAKHVGWSAQMIGTDGTTTGWVNAMTQAISLKPNAIIYSMDAATLKGYNAKAAKLGITLIGLHAVAFAGPGAYEEYDNITSNPTLIGRAEAEYAIAASCGTAKVIIQYDSTFAVAAAKALAMKAEMELCTTCKILDVVNSPLAELESLEPGLCSGWVSKYGTGWYAMTIYDGVWDYCIPSLKAAGVGPSAVHLIGSDGTPASYSRMRAGQYQVATVPEPAQLQAYIAINEVNRAVLGLKPDYGSGAGMWSQPVYVAFQQTPFGGNLSLAGGTKGQYFPANNYASILLKDWGVK